jgi:hypothetical protein
MEPRVLLIIKPDTAAVVEVHNDSLYMASQNEAFDGLKPSVVPAPHKPAKSEVTGTRARNL